MMESHATNVKYAKVFYLGSSTDVIEMDAASNNGVDDIRQIRDEVSFLPTSAKYRVYIIDEVHMLSIAAFNALLKTLEEPPAHVIFILATTEPHKLPTTILSRCQRFDFKQIPFEEIKKCLKHITDETNIQIEDDALSLIANLSDGALRDAISILERTILDGTKEKVTLSKIKDLVGLPETSYIYNLSKAIINYDIQNAIKSLNEIISTGKDISNFIWQIIQYIKDILVYKETGELKLYSAEESEQIKDLAKQCDSSRLIEIIVDLSETENKIKLSSKKSIIFETAIIKLCQKRMPIENVQIINTTVPKTSVKAPEVKQAVAKPSTSSVKAQITNVSTGNYIEDWPTIVNNLKTSGKVMLYTNLLNSKAKKLNDLIIGIELDPNINNFGKSVVTRPDNMIILENEIFKTTGEKMHIKCIDENNDENQALSSPIENLANNIGIPIDVIDD